MNYIMAADTDIGLTKDTNQDCLYGKVASTKIGKIVLMVVCDGMGGLSHGEQASATVIDAFKTWSEQSLPAICNRGMIEDATIRSEWTQIVLDCNERIKGYGKQIAQLVGTTVTAVLLTPNRYYIINVGDTRAYEITDTIKVLTEDHTIVAQDVRRGYITEEEAEKDIRRSVLLQGIGASENIYPDFFFGTTRKDAVYMLCSDGFRHEVKAHELFEGLRPERMLDADGMCSNIRELIELNKQRNETDNITCLATRTF